MMQLCRLQVLWLVVGWTTVTHFQESLQIQSS